MLKQADTLTHDSINFSHFSHELAVKRFKTVPIKLKSMNKKLISSSLTYAP